MIRPDRRHSLDAKGIVFHDLPHPPVVVAAAGNAGSSRPAYPAAIGEVIAVAATTDVERAWFSNYGPWVDACAPRIRYAAPISR